MGHGREHAEYHAEAVIQRNRNADAVIRSEPHPLSGKESIVHHVEMRQRRALRRPGRTARELDVEHLIRIQPLHRRVQRRLVEILSRPHEFVEREDAAHRLGTQLHQQTQFREGRAGQPSGRGCGELGDQRLKHGDVVAGLEPGREYERTTADEAQRELKFTAAVRGIDVHQHEAGTRGREHRQYPLDAVRRPYTDTVARHESAGNEPARSPLHLAIQFREGESNRLERHHQGDAVRCRSDGGLQNTVDGTIEQRLLADAGYETQAGTSQSCGLPIPHLTPRQPPLAGAAALRLRDARPRSASARHPRRQRPGRARSVL